MKRGNISLIRCVLLAGSAACFAACVNTVEPWSQQEELEHMMAQVHHWGQKGESSPNRGWASYGTLRFGSLGYRYELDQASDELEIIVQKVGSDRPVLKTLSIPRVGLFNAGEEPKDCFPDEFEFAGLRAEQVLFLLAQAFPEGPELAQSSKHEIKGQPSELRFLQGVLRMKAAWSATVSVSKPEGQADRIHFEIGFDGKAFAIGDWIRTGPSTLVADTDALDGWRACWFGHMDSSGVLTDRNRAAKLHAAKTFGEVRQLKEQVILPAETSGEVGQRRNRVWSRSSPDL
jgi:hypothetical protein